MLFSKLKTSKYRTGSAKCNLKSISKIMNDKQDPVNTLCVKINKITVYN